MSTPSRRYLPSCPAERPCAVECRYRLPDAAPYSCALDAVDARPDGWTLEAIGDVFNVTRERVRQIEAVALDRLVRGLRAAGMHPSRDWRRLLAEAKPHEHYREAALTDDADDDDDAAAA